MRQNFARRLRAVRFSSTSAPNSSTQKAAEQANKALETAKRLGGQVGETFGKLLGGYRQPLVYNLSVAREVLKQVYIRESLAPPTSVSAFTSTYSALWANARNPAYWREIARSGEWARVGIYGLEAYFVFHVGEMIGRRSLVGYKLD
ncbi:hypothetical protein BOTBODRAFT_108037 [Botryobasidium botryosum FD-172 SS1]|uniref:ATP synthase subunit G ATP20 n=1 Tax=Botryobasidium botryosum (strain FD-172 SS1) TaxID=930990 RepID=A0A067MJE0_BOTB1|nr:hypothetical protein BOTBODRAFT_108037 [Botryobasidium botryosum FD-172 SS1]